MTPAEVQVWIRQQTRPCPCCGAGVLIQVDTDARGQELWRAVAQHPGLRLAIVSVEDAEQEILAGGFEQTGQSVGGRPKR